MNNMCLGSEEMGNRFDNMLCCRRCSAVVEAYGPTYNRMPVHDVVRYTAQEIDEMIEQAYNDPYNGLDAFLQMEEANSSHNYGPCSQNSLDHTHCPTCGNISLLHNRADCFYLSL